MPMASKATTFDLRVKRVVLDIFDKELKMRCCAL